MTLPAPVALLQRALAESRATDPLDLLGVACCLVDPGTDEGDTWAVVVATHGYGALLVAAETVARVAQGAPPPRRWTEGEWRPSDDVRRDLVALGALRRTFAEEDAHHREEQARRAAEWRAGQERRRREQPQEADRERRYAQAAVDRACADVAGAGEGGRNWALNRAAYSLAGLVAGGYLDEEPTVEALVAAAMETGVPEREARRVVAAGFAAGLRRPRRAGGKP